MRRVAAATLLAILTYGWAVVTAATAPSPYLPVPQAEFVPYPLPPSIIDVVWKPDRRLDPVVHLVRTPIPAVTRAHRVAHVQPAVRIGVHSPRLTSGHVVGVATWYCEPGVSVCTHGYPAYGAYGAAGPALRAALGDWRGRTVWVNGVAVRLIDWCACGGGHVIDVYHATWLRIPHPNEATIRW